MSTDARADAALALHRFGLGPREGSIAAIAGDPRGALLAEITRPAAGQIANPGLPSAAAASREAFEDTAARRARQITAQRAKQAAEAAPSMMTVSLATQAPAETTQAEPPVAQQILLKEARARTDAAITANIGFAERLVWFWSNHFCISSADVPAMAGGYEREAIRPHILGRFADMLLAAEGHPAMLTYLDNASSMGPGSVAGINRNRGLNENFAREVLELHTLGVRTGYTQADVTSFAKVLTGWTILPTVDNPDHGGEFIFNRRLHEPGPQTIMGKVYPDSGAGQARAVLMDLARHPATARHVATKLARHFVADQPPPALVERLAAKFRDTDGDLKEVTAALIAAPDAWAQPRAKLKRPGEWMAGLLRAVDIRDPDMQRVMGGLALMGEPLWRPPAPNGFSDDSAVWIDGLPQRLDIANLTGERNAPRIDPVALVDTALGPLASAETRRTVAQAASRGQGIALALMAPEFLRR